MALFDPEKRLERAQIPVVTDDLPDGIHGFSYRQEGRMMVVVDRKLSRIERRCTLTHEYFHLMLFRGSPFSFHATHAERLEGDIVESRVRRATASRLVPTRRLRRMVLDDVPIDEVAERLSVTEEIVRDALQFQRQRGGENPLFW